MIPLTGTSNRIPTGTTSRATNLREQMIDEAVRRFMKNDTVWGPAMVVRKNRYNYSISLYATAVNRIRAEFCRIAEAL